MVFFITAALFLTAFYASNYFNNKKVAELKSIQDKVSVDILSSETQFALLEELACKDVTSSVLSEELNTLSEKIDYSEKNIGSNDPEVVALKKYYSLLEIKDYLLMKKVSERCGTKYVFALYFYSNKDCDDCYKQWQAIAAMRNRHPEFRIYTFDYNLDLSAIKALTSIYKVGTDLPALVMNDTTYHGFVSLEDIEKAFPELAPKPEMTKGKTPKPSAKKPADDQSQ